MPSPIGHSLMGYTVYLAASPKKRGMRKRLLLFSLIAANIPDLDFLPGLIMGELRRYHHGASHSILFSMLFGLMIGVVYKIICGDGFKKGFVLACVLYLSHIILDYFVRSPGRGVPLFWPFYDGYFMTSVVVFPYFDYLSSDGTSFGGILSLHNLKTITVEAGIIFLFLLAVLLWRNNSVKSE